MSLNLEPTHSESLNKIAVRTCLSLLVSTLLSFLFIWDIINIEHEFQVYTYVLSVTGLRDTVNDVSKLSSEIGMSCDFHMEEKVLPPGRYRFF